MKIGVFVDVSNLYYTISKKYGKRLNYQSYLNFIKDLGTVSIAQAYGAQTGKEARNFIYTLKKVGFTPKYKAPKAYIDTLNPKKKADWDVGIAVDMIQTTLTTDIDTFILGSADSDLEPVVEWLKSRSKRVIVLATGISKELYDSANQCIEIPESLLQ